MSVFTGSVVAASTLKRPWPFSEDAQQPYHVDERQSFDEISGQRSDEYVPDLFVEDEGQTATPLPAVQDDVQQQSPVELTCYGSIVHSMVQIVDSGLARNLSQSSIKVRSFPVLQDGRFFSIRYGGGVVARLNKALSKALDSLSKEHSIQAEAYIKTEDLAGATASDNFHRTNKSSIAIELNLYGNRTDAEAVGAALSGSGIYLQYPNKHGRKDAEYWNPHVLEIEGYGLESNFEDNSGPTAEAPPSSSTPQQDQEDDRTANDTVAVDRILDSLSHHVQLQNVHVDRRIKSTLLAHQQEAIHFVGQRESGQVPSEQSLWKRNDLDADEPFYQHVFTGAKRPQQDEATGGIVADEMGLGKSLVMLSVVAGSFDQGEEFFKAESELLEMDMVNKIPSKATLILAPSSLLIDSWVDELRKHTFPGALTFHKHIGQARHAETARLRDCAIVFTTYATVATEYARGNSALFKINWFRIVLDEAHDIRNRATKQFQAVASLSAKHRWCLTGTPIQNTLEDLGALVSFLRVPILENVPTYRKFIMTPTTSGAKGRFKNLRTLLQTVCIRRTRDLLDLPKPVPQIRLLPLTNAERAEYEKLLHEGRTMIDKVVSGHVKRSVNSTILESLLRLRLFCNHGSANSYLLMGPNGLPSDPDEALSYLQQLEQDSCAYCNGTVYSIDDSAETDGGMLMASCTHLVCRNCMPDHTTNKRSCPICPDSTGEASSAVQTVANNQAPILFNNFPSKLRALVDDLWNDKAHKSIVFSNWKKTLKLVGQMLDASDISYDSIDGSLKLAQRRKVLDDFRSPTGANILLMTLGTGAVGLNLAVASRIYLLEPQWNPSVEAQAIGRALRLGQTDQVVIKRYIMKDTVEQV